MTSIDSTPVVAEAHSHGESHEHPDYSIWGLITFLSSEFLMFAGFFATYLILFSQSAGEWPPEETEVELLLPAINTVILVSSSFVINFGVNGIKQGDQQKLRLGLGLTALMGIVFLGGQVWEYLSLGYGLTTNTFANCFYLMTGFHGLHVLVGVLLILGVWWKSRVPGHYSEEKHIGVEVAEIYWHFVDGVWLIVFGLIYILTLF